MSRKFLLGTSILLAALGANASTNTSDNAGQVEQQNKIEQVLNSGEGFSSEFIISPTQSVNADDLHASHASHASHSSHSSHSSSSF